MRFLANPHECEKEVSTLVRKCKSIRWAVAWASHGFPLFNTLEKFQEKIEQLSVGVHFYQTHPDFIEAFIANSRVQFVMNPNGVFHPKLYLFEHEDGSWDCITGSPNFTHGGFSSNSEVSVCFDSNDVGATDAYAKIDSTLNEFFSAGRKLSPKELNAYRKIWKRQQRRLASLSGTYSPPSKKSKPTKSPLDVPLFMMEWPDFYDSVKEDTEHTTEGRLAVLETARRCFSDHLHFHNIDHDSRRGIAGFGEVEGIDWLWFGSMKGAGYYKQAINQNSQQVSEALDKIPLTGEITEQHFNQYLELFRTAFEKSGIATATRLLAMKRPDYFICLDSKNRSKLCEAFVIPKTVGLDDYWEKVVERLTDSNWWNSEQPEDPQQRRIWSGRAAFLDVLFYEPD
jgi:HKD family nuclease